MKVEVVGPNEALIISGFMHSPPTMIVGGRALVIPCLHKVQKLQLSTMTLAIKTDRVYTNLGVPICVTGIAQVRFLFRSLFGISDMNFFFSFCIGIQHVLWV
jgi:uncharacterized membrane protein YqiK